MRHERLRNPMTCASRRVDACLPQTALAKHGMRVHVPPTPRQSNATKHSIDTRASTNATRLSERNKQQRQDCPGATKAHARSPNALLLCVAATTTPTSSLRGPKSRPPQDNARATRAFASEAKSALPPNCAVFRFIMLCHALAICRSPLGLSRVLGAMCSRARGYTV